MAASAQSFFSLMSVGDDLSSAGNCEDKATNKRDAKLLGRITTDDRGAMTELFRIYYPALVAFGMRFAGDKDVAEEAAHEVLLKLWERRATVSPKSLRAYLYLAVRNKCRSYGRHNDASRRAWTLFAESCANEGLVAYDDAVPDPDKVTADARIACMFRLINSLPESSRRVLLLHHEHGMSYAEIAAILEISHRTVERLMGNALQVLRRGILSSE